MAVIAAEPRTAQNGFRQQQAIGDDDGDIRIEGTKLCAVFIRPEIFRRQHRNAQKLRRLMHGRFLQIEAAPPAGTRRLRVDGNDLVARLLEASQGRSEEHTSELQSLMRISYAVFCLT